MCRYPGARLPLSFFQIFLLVRFLRRRRAGEAAWLVRGWCVAGACVAATAAFHAHARTHTHASGHSANVLTGPPRSHPLSQAIDILEKASFRTLHAGAERLLYLHQPALPIGCVATCHGLAASSSEPEPEPDPILALT